MGCAVPSSAPARRSGNRRNGSWNRDFHTRAGTLDVAIPGPHRVRRIQRRRQAGPVHGRATGARMSAASPSRCCARARAAPSRRRSPLRSGRTRRSGAGRAASAAGSPRCRRWRPPHLSRNRQGSTQESMSLTGRARPPPAADERTRTPRRTCGSPTRSVAFLFSAPAVAPCQAEFVY
jgi:hypothetical protein